MKKIAGVILFLLISSNSYAGNIQKAVVAGITYQSFSRIILPAVLEGKGLAKAIAVAKKVGKSSIGKNWIYEILTFYIVARRDTPFAQNAANIIIGAQLDDKAFTQNINKQMRYFDDHVEELKKRAFIISKDKNYQCNQMSRMIIYDKNLNLLIRNIQNPVQSYNFGAYKELHSNYIKDDDLEHDHIPSIKAVLEYLKRRDKSTGMKRESGLGGIVNRNASAIELPSSTHKTGRTYASKNKDIYLDDSYNLSVATIKDFAYYEMNSPRINPSMFIAFSGIYARNQYLCLYE